MKKKILFICETVTHAHLMRTSTLMKGLNQNEFEVYLAAGVIPSFLRFELESIATVLPLEHSVKPSVFLKDLSRGLLPYNEELVEEQVREDIDLIERFRPDIVVGDFRLSLHISARVKKVPYINITNLTWHPDAQLQAQVPDLKIVRVLGEKLMLKMNKFGQPIVFKKLLRPFAKVSHKWNVAAPESLLDLYVSGDGVFFADSASLVKVDNLSQINYVCAPILASFVENEDTTPRLLKSRPNVILSLGSSGNHLLIPRLVEILGKLHINLFVSTSGMKIDIPPKENIFVADYLPLQTLLSRTDVLICNGGSASGYLALSQGIPFIAIPSNLDQFNFTAAVVAKGAALRIRPEKVSTSSVRIAIEKILSTKKFHEAALKIATLMHQEVAAEQFSKLIHKTLGAQNHEVVRTLKSAIEKEK